MNSSEYIFKLKNALNSYFDITENYEINNECLPIYAKSVIRNERYIGSKNIVIDAYESHEHCLVKAKKAFVNEKDIKEFLELLKYTSDKFIHPHKEHMSTIISGVYITEIGFTDKAIQLGKKFKFRKNYAFGFRGWSNIHAILIDLNSMNIYVNKDGKKSKNFYKSLFQSL
ncbi:hypothetical protein NSA23_10620 [Anaerosalibacter massiliensis]|uniref:DUF8052 domain-containing protein n=1 Tax=Anaerosalibacter massiliensis TaxID=1347392 RepID=A0A9X2S5H8_9FIRM|nr:hypothetical protein [Anaerosalibacter massiliensis]MCR2044563.1 hypothetical protein [Anaerosalibacter massiliensis]